MERSHRIVIFTPHLDGDYFGKILGTINRIAVLYRWQLNIVQTQVNHPYGSMIDDPLMLDAMDACILILDSVGEQTKRRLAASGKPILSIGYLQEDMPCHSVLIDNRYGMMQAVNHLIEHGHTAIAYIGTQYEGDQCERLTAYREALACRGIPYNPELVVNAPSNLIAGGLAGIESLIARRVPYTAVVAGTDKNAFGVITGLREHGIAVPADVAVTGFDDVEQAADIGYALTTVKQDYAKLAETAAGILRDALAGRRADSSVTKLHVSLVLRSSCGCTAGMSCEDSRRDIERYQATIAELRSSLRQVETDNAAWIQTLIDSTSTEQFGMEQLFSLSAKWGYLALWDDSGEHRRLIIDRGFSRIGIPTPPLGLACEAGEFPPLDALPASAQGGGTDSVVLHPVKNDRHDWGYMVLVGPLDQLSTVFSSNLAHQSYNLLAALLDRESLFARIRTIAEQLQIVSNATNDGIWDWDLETNRVKWNSRMHELLAPLKPNIRDEDNDFLHYVHPDDRARIMERIRAHIEDGTPYQVEYRMLAAPDSPPIWLYAVGEVMRDRDGRPYRMVGSITDITDKKADEARIRHLAYHDALTGLPNRAYLLEHAMPVMAQQWSRGLHSAILLMDLDRFKLTNDTLGHLAGDQLLRHVSDKLRACAGPGSIVARLGGDEFIVMLSPISGIEAIESFAGALLQSLSEPLVIENREIYVTASIGACLYPDHGETIETLIKHADMSMYKAKENGRDQLVLYTADLSSNTEMQFVLANNLRKAVERGEFSLHYQPQIDLSSGRILGAEALLRWHSAEHGIVQPNDFIPLAEETGWIVPISVWVVREACRQIIEWQRKGMPELTISVNVSAHHFRQQQFSAWIRSVLEASGVEPRLLCLEITETTAIQNMEHSVEMLQELADLGIRIAIDDFGTGHSSLMLLKRLPIHHVKIDKSFVRDMTTDHDDAAIVKAVIAMSHSLGLTTIAEGVEEQEQLRHLRRLGCDHIQGYLIGKPMPAEWFERFMTDREARPIPPGSRS